MMNNRLRILITDAGSVNALAIVRHLGLSKKYEIHAVAYNHLAISKFSKYCDRFYVIAHPKKSPGQFSLELKRIITQQAISFLMPVGFYAHKVVIEEQQSFNDIVKTCLPLRESFEIATSKIDTGNLAEKAGVLVPKTLVIRDIAELSSQMQVRFPVVIKSQKEIGGRMVEYANSAAELKEKFTDLVKTHQLQPDNFPIIQEYIEGDGTGFFAFYKNGTLQHSFMHERVREFPVSGGRSVCARSFDDARLRQSGTAVLDALKWNGCAMVEFKRTKNNEYYLLEVNPKLWGSLELAICAGVNFPELMINDTMQPAHNNVAVSYRNDLYFQWCLNGELYHVFNRPASIPAVFKTLFSSKKDFWFRDIKPNLMQVLLVFIDLYKVIKSKL